MDENISRVAGELGRQFARSHSAIGTADLVAELQKQPRETRLDARPGQFREAARQFGEAQRQAREQPADEGRLRLEQAEERGLFDAEHLRRFEAERR